MPTRKPFVGGNWKMNLNQDEAVALARAVAGCARPDVQVAVAPPLVYLAQVASELGHSQVLLAAQNGYWQPNGPFTGEVSLSMLQDVGVKVLLVGHSERRWVIQETDALINHKVLAALEDGFEVILCVGETIEQRRADQTDAINTAQINYGLAGVRSDQMAQVTIAYEPLWAIGTGQTATPDDAQQACRMIRRALTHLFSTDVARATRIQYGGSVKPSNAAALFARDDIDGGLIGGASMDASTFAAIVTCAATAKAPTQLRC